MVVKPLTRMVVKPLRCGLPRRHRQLRPRCLRRLHGPPRLHGLSNMKVRSSLSGAIAGFSSTALRQPSMVSWFSPVDRRLRQRFFSALSDDSNPSLAQPLASTLLLWSGMPPPCRNLLVCPPAELPNGSSSSSTDSCNIVKKKREKKVKKKQKRKGGQNLRWSTLQAKVGKTCAGLRFKRYLQVTLLCEKHL